MLTPSAVTVTAPASAADPPAAKGSRQDLPGLSVSPTAHAEMVAIRLAAEQLRQPRLHGCTLWVTLEPCAMCAAAVALARLDGLRFGAEDPKGGGVVHGARFFSQPTCHHRPAVLGGIGDAEAAALLRSFFDERR